MSNSHLCQSCSVFNNSSRRFLSSPFSEMRVHQLGMLSDVKARDNCPLCQLLASAFTSPSAPRARSKYDHTNLRVQGSWQQLFKDEDSAFLTFHLIDPEYQSTVLTVRPVDTERAGCARVLTSPFVDVESVKRWVATCEGRHQCAEAIPQSTRESGMIFRVIDVKRRRIVMMKHEVCRYNALSYVWGKGTKFTMKSTNIAQLSQPQGLQKVWELLPPTIQDAIVFTERMGESYVWIDSLCITQDDPIEAAVSFPAMDLVYQRALTVICATDNQAVEHGMAGISKPRSITSFVADLAPDVPVQAQFSVLEFVASSRYHRRGWIFQEEQLGIRNLVFTNNQVYFICLQCVKTEDVLDGSDDKVNPFNVSNNYLDRNKPASLAYFEAVEDYTSRDLSYPSDVLKAFSGFLQVQQRMIGTDSLSGLPTSIFDMALLWQPVGPMQRRDGFPSWSWAGWQGRVRWSGDTMELASERSSASKDAEKLKITMWLRDRTWINWFRIGSGTEEPVWRPSAITETIDPVQIGYNPDACSAANPYGRNWDMTSLPQCLASIHRGDFTLASQQEVYLRQSPETHLVFQTYVCKYRIQPSNEYLRYASLDPMWLPNGRTIFHIRNCNDAVCGYVLLDDRWKDIYATAISPVYTFLLLSEANYYSNWRIPHETHPYKKFYGEEDYEEFHVMMVEEKDYDGVRVLERAGIGRLLKEATQDACEDIEWRTVLLD